MASSCSSTVSTTTTLHRAILALEERCQRQQKRIEDLEKENVSVQTSRRDIYTEVKKLHQANVKLRERNLKLSQELERTSKDNVSIKEDLESLQEQHSNSLRIIAHLQDELHSRSTTPSSSFSSSSSSPPSMDKKNHDYDFEKRELALRDMKMQLLAQRNMIIKIMPLIRKMSSNKVSTTSSTTTTTTSKINVRKCPMCEVSFPDSIPQKDFECHVIQHFTYEEVDTLVGYDVVPDVDEAMLDACS